MPKTINLMMFFDNLFFNSAITCLSSILDNTYHPIVLYFDGDLDAKNTETLKSLSNRLKIIRLEGVHKKSASLYKGNHRWPSITLNRLFGPYKIDNNIDRLIYLDADIVVVSDLFELQEMNLGEKIIGASGKDYFNAGVIVYDINLLFKDTNEEMIIDLLTNDNINLPYLDQDVLNILFKDKYYDIGVNYNYRAWNTFIWKNPIKHGAKIIHYLGKIKPDNYKWIEWKANKPFWKYALPVYGKKYRIKLAIKSFFWYPVALYRRFRYHTGAKD